MIGILPQTPFFSLREKKSILRVAFRRIILKYCIIRIAFRQNGSFAAIKFGIEPFSKGSQGVGDSVPRVFQNKKDKGGDEYGN